MGVPWHDERDRVFAEANKLPFGEPVLNEARTHLINSGIYTGLTVEEARERLASELAARGLGTRHTSYKLRDWLVSRQRPWGAPIPIVHCKSCGPVPLDASQLPVKRKKLITGFVFLLLIED